MSKAVNLSEYQQRIIDWVGNGTGSCVVIAVAGAGKTFTIEQSLPHIPEDKYVSIYAFNKTIAEELKARIAKMAKEQGRAFRNFRAQTFHSMGVSAVAYRLKMPIRSLVIDDKKCRTLCETLMPKPQGDDFEGGGLSEYAMYAEFVCKLVGFAKGEGVRTLRPDTPDVWWELIRHHDLSLEDESASEERAIELARDLLIMSNKAASHGVTLASGQQTQPGWIDYNDMLYLPLLWNLRLFQSDWVLVDEAQDTNPVRRALAKKALKPGGRSMWVGDPKQAIYGFTGASADAIDLIKREFNAAELPLTVCYRCAPEIVAEAKTIVPYIEAAPGAAGGKVERLPEAEALAILDEHDAILCRNTAPLITTAMRLIASGRAAKVLGRDIGVGLVSLIKKMKARTIDQLEAKLAKYAERETAKFMARGEEGKADRINDTVDCIRVVIGGLDEGKGRTVAGVIAKIESLFSDTNGCLTLSTVHKAKGREWNRVAILQPELMPSKFARQEWQYEQEMNLKYVAITRAEHHLIWMQTPVKPVEAK